MIDFSVNINDFILDNTDTFADAYIQVIDSIKDYFTQHIKMKRAELIINIQMDETDPAGKKDDNAVYIKYNGRMTLPKKINNERELLEKWAEENSVDLTMDDTEDELIKFTMFLPLLDVSSVTTIEEEPVEEVEPIDLGGGGGDPDFGTDSLDELDLGEPSSEPESPGAPEETSITPPTKAPETPEEV